MVFFRRAALQASECAEAGPGEHFRGVSMEPFNSIPPDLCAEQGLAYLRLLTQLARCGLDAAGPPLMEGAHR